MTGSVCAFAHAGITVRSMERSLAFYLDGLGLQCTSRRVVADKYVKEIVQVAPLKDIEVALLSLNGESVIIELLEYRGHASRPFSSQPSDVGSGHVCLAVDDIKDVIQRTVAAGGVMRSPRPVRIQNGPYAGGARMLPSGPTGTSSNCFN